MKVLFHTNTLNYRGTAVSTTQYAKYNQEILGNTSVISYNKNISYEKDMGTEEEVLANLRKDFEVVEYENILDLEKIIDKQGIDAAYFQVAGNKDVVPTNTKSLVHTVFQYNEPYGNVYAYISEWLSKFVSKGEHPFVPYIVDLPSPNKSYREMLGIREDQVVLGRIGGYYTFDIVGVKAAIIELVQNTDKYVFLFVGTEPFVNHPNVKFIKEIHSPQLKANFINSCDAMIHARSRGESFGLAVAEFLYFNKPVVSWAGGTDLNHLVMLENSNTLYSGRDSLLEIISNIDTLKNKEDWSKRVANYSPKLVMQKFNEVFLQ